ncbi:MAG: phage shock protein PspC [Thermoleophilia bacterium]|nr:phage shock protein PspC [Thermoleophilia bacterium]
MNRVTIVNLAGHAWHVEDAGVQSLDTWLDQARTRLATDPDRDELMLDFERAIADRLEHLAPGERDVVTASQVDDVLAALGTVEPAHDTERIDIDPDAEDAGATIPMAASAAPGPGEQSWRDRRLYRLTGEDALLAGVCSGLAAYLRLDVTVIRVAVVVLTILTSGAGIIAYIVMALIVPEARSPEQRAEALGTGRTAEEMLARARAQASPALATLGSIITRAVRALVVLTRWVLLAAIWLLLAGWALTIGWLVLDPDSLLDLFDAGTSAWLVGLWVTCIAWIPFALLLAIERGVAAVSRRADERRTSRPARIAVSSAWVVSLVVAVLGMFAIPASHSTELAGLSDGRTTVEVDGERFCIDAEHSEIYDGSCSDQHELSRWQELPQEPSQPSEPTEPVEAS